VSQFDCGDTPWKPCYNYWMDWRGWTIVALVVAAVVATGLIYYSGNGLDPATHFGAVFAAWVGGLALFIITGIVVAIISLARPERESFDARARILFRRQAGKHIDYIVSKIKEVLEHYAERTVIKVTIREFHSGEKKFRVASINESLVRSYLDDVETTYISSMEMNDITLPPAGGTPNRLVYVRVAGNPVGLSEDFTVSVKRPISCRIDRDAACEISSMKEFWIQADTEPNTHRPRRYTQLLCLQFENLLPSDQAIDIKLTLDGTNWITERFLHGTSRQVAAIKDAKPGDVVFDYRLMAP